MVRVCAGRWDGGVGVGEQAHVIYCTVYHTYDRECQSTIAAQQYLDECIP